MRMPACLLLCLVFTAMAAPARAQDVVVSFDSAGTQGQSAVQPFTTFSLYVIGRDVGDVVGWEIAMVPPPSITVSNRIINNGPGVNLGGDDNYILGLGACYGTPGEDYLFITYELVYLTAPPSDDTFCVVAPAYHLGDFSMIYVTCENDIVEFCAGNLTCSVTIPDGCALINPSGPPCILTKRWISCDEVPTQTTSWSALKAAY